MLRWFRQPTLSSYQSNKQTFAYNQEPDEFRLPPHDNDDLFYQDRAVELPGKSIQSPVILSSKSQVHNT